MSYPTFHTSFIEWMWQLLLLVVLCLNCSIFFLKDLLTLNYYLPSMGVSELCCYRVVTVSRLSFRRLLGHVALHETTNFLLQSRKSPSKVACARTCACGIHVLNVVHVLAT